MGDSSTDKPQIAGLGSSNNVFQEQNTDEIEHTSEKSHETPSTSSVPTPVVLPSAQDNLLTCEKFYRSIVPQILIVHWILHVQPTLNQVNMLKGVVKALAKRISVLAKLLILHPGNLSVASVIRHGTLRVVILRVYHQ